MKTVTHIVLITATSSLVAGCHSWRREAITPSTSYEAPRVRLRADGVPMQLENVRVEGDSLRGSRRFAGQPAESVAVALSSLKELEAWRTDSRKTFGFVAGVTIPFAFVMTRPCFVLRPCHETPPVIPLN
jgi:hypothetical protein